MKSDDIDEITRSHKELGIKQWNTTCQDYIGPDKKRYVYCTVLLSTIGGYSASYTSIASSENCGVENDREILIAKAQDSAYTEAKRRLQSLKDNKNVNYGENNQQNHIPDNSYSGFDNFTKSAPQENLSGKVFNHSKTKHMSDNQKSMILGRCNQQRLDADHISRELFNHSLEKCSSFVADKIIKHISKLHENNDY
jgi:hypothetical protein